MTLERAQAEFKAATEAYEAAKRGVSEQRFAAQNCMQNSLGFAEMVEYTTHQNWLRAHKNLTALQPPPAPKPVIAHPQPTPKPVVAKPALVATKPVASASTPMPVKPPAVRVPDPQPLIVPEAEKSEMLLHFEDRCRDSELRWRRRYGLTL